MAEVTAFLVKELREKTGAGMMDCKNALTEASDLEGAVKILREKGLARAAKKTSRVAAEGLVGIALGDHAAAMVELNCETDFVSRNDDFKKLLHDVANTVLKYNGPDLDAMEIDGARLNECLMSNGATVASVITDKVATIGEKIAVRRFALQKGGDVYGHYIHGTGNIGVLVEGSLGDKKHGDLEQVKLVMRDIAMHVAASQPSFIRESEIPKSWLDSERDIFRKQVLASGKPENMVEKIVDGKMAKHKKDYCLLDQPFVKNPDLSVQEILDELRAKAGALLNITKMVRFKVGEGIEKPVDNFAEEVKKMTA